MKKALCFILALMLFVGLTACDSAPKGETFYLYEIQENGETIHMEDLRKEIEAESNGVRMEEFFYVTLFDDGTAIICSMGTKKDMKYNDNSIWAAEDERIKASLTRVGDTIAITDDGAIMVYRKG